MLTDTKTHLQAIDPAVLTDVVRQDQRSPNFEITSWTAGVLSNKGVANPDGLFVFSGEGCDENGARSWSVVLKVIRTSRSEDIQSYFYDMRELLVYQSGLLDRLPKILVAPRCYLATTVNGAGWVWMEHIHDESPKRWDDSHFMFAAKQLGLFTAAMLRDDAIPRMPWFCHDSLHPRETPMASFKKAHVKRHLDEDVQERVSRLWDELESFKRVRSRLPQVICHGDANRRNLMVRQAPDRAHQLIAIDWPKFGVGPVGAELYSLVGTSAFLHEYAPANLHTLSEQSFDAYVGGLQEGGWQGRKDLVRLAYLSLSATVYGLTAPFVIANFDPAQETAQAEAQRMVGLPAEAFNAGTAEVCRFGLDCADEARRMMRKLNV